MKISILDAGPAGSTAAYYLAKNGIDVELIYKVKFPRDKPCAGGLFNPFLYSSEFPYIKEAEGKYIYKAKFYCGKYSAEYTSQKPLLKMFLRKDFDYFLFQKAINEGAKFFINKKPTGITAGYDAYIQAGKIYVRIGDGTSQETAISANTYNDDIWHLLVVTFDRSDKIRIYVDNELDGESESIAGVGNCDNNEIFCIGNRLDNSLYFNGPMDVVGVFDKVLSANERDFLWNNGNGNENLWEQILSVDIASQPLLNANIISLM